MNRGGGAEPSGAGVERGGRRGADRHRREHAFILRSQAGPLNVPVAMATRWRALSLSLPPSLQHLNKIEAIYRATRERRRLQTETRRRYTYAHAYAHSHNAPLFVDSRFCVFCGFLHAEKEGGACVNPTAAAAV